MSLLDREDRRLLNKARTLGNGQLSIVLSDHQLLRLLAVVAIDLGKDDLVADIAAPAELNGGYYNLPADWFVQPVNEAINLREIFLRLKSEIPDFATYFNSLCGIHKRRLKFSMILERQALPLMEQIVPRCLLEYGAKPPELLASWLIWRKWIYDIDNRSAQETGYLFEPILAAAIGGISVSAKSSPIRRTNDSNKGRQVDCLDSTDRIAYEFKMRVTIAASGQGRFQEELDFAQDCRNSGFVPILLVLDPTPSSRLDDLSAQFESYGGTTYIGQHAWNYIEQRAGSAMGHFVEQYIRVPLSQVDESFDEVLPLKLSFTGPEIVIDVGSERFSIQRSALQLESTEDESEE